MTDLTQRSRQEHIARARLRWHRRHGTSELALCALLVPIVESSSSWPEADDRVRRFLTKHRRRFWWALISDAQFVMHCNVHFGIHAQ